MLIDEIQWNAKTSWQFYSDQESGTLYIWSGEQRLYAFSLRNPENLREFLRVVLTQYHASNPLLVSEAILNIIRVMNEFTLMQMKMENEYFDSQQDDNVSGDDGEGVP